MSPPPGWNSDLPSTRKLTKSEKKRQKRKEKRAEVNENKENVAQVTEKQNDPPSPEKGASSGDVEAQQHDIEQPVVTQQPDIEQPVATQQPDIEQPVPTQQPDTEQPVKVPDSETKVSKDTPVVQQPPEDDKPDATVCKSDDAVPQVTESSNEDVNETKRSRTSHEDDRHRHDKGESFHHSHGQYNDTHYHGPHDTKSGVDYARHTTSSYQSQTNQQYNNRARVQGSWHNKQTGGGQGGYEQHQGQQQQRYNNDGKQAQINSAGGQSSYQQGSYASQQASPTALQYYSGLREPTEKEKQFWSEYDDVLLSKELVRVLRHGKYRKINLDPEGYAFIKDIIWDDRFYNTTYIETEDHVVHLVKNNDKKRFELKETTQGLKIKATQGHTVKIQNLELTPLTDPTRFSEIVHGTYWEAWEIIQREGLNRMKRNHIHFAVGLPGEREVISGMRNSSEIVIELDLAKALKAGLKFFTSSNNVILSEGDHHGRIHPKFFRRALQIWPEMTTLKFEVPPDYDDNKYKKDSKTKRESDYSRSSAQDSRQRGSQMMSSDKPPSGSNKQSEPRNKQRDSDRPNTSSNRPKGGK